MQQITFEVNHVLGELFMISLGSSDISVQFSVAVTGALQPSGVHLPLQKLGNLLSLSDSHSCLASSEEWPVISVHLIWALFSSVSPWDPWLFSFMNKTAKSALLTQKCVWKVRFVFVQTFLPSSLPSFFYFLYTHPAIHLLCLNVKELCEVL